MYDLKALQRKELEILGHIHRACEQLGVRYFIMYGTLLGAVRHKGFIPWDDDMDICMTREDYDLFIEKGQQYLPENLRIQHYTTEADCPNIFAKVRDRNTTFLHKEHIELDINQGIYVDIFPVDRMRGTRPAIAWALFRRTVFNLLNGCYDLPFVKEMERGPKRMIGYLVHYTASMLLVRPSRAAFTKREEKNRRKKHRRGGDRVLFVIGKNTIPYSLLSEYALYEIEGEQFWGPKDYHTVLTALYGDYMQLPPEDQRETHEPLFVDVDRGYSKEELDQMSF